MSSDKALLGMSVARLATGLLQVAAAYLMWKLASVETALRLNAFLGLVGPAVFVAVSAMGLLAISGKLPGWKMSLSVLGVLMILVGTSK